jgi:excisionase family DNA binding protein
MALLTTMEAGQFLKMHPVTVRNKARAKEIPAVRVGGRWRFDENALREWVAQGCPSQATQASLFD